MYAGRGAPPYDPWNPIVKAYLIRRFLLIFPTFLGISIITFLVVQLAPGNPVYLKLRAAGGAMSAEGVTPEIIEQTKKMYGLDRPMHERYVLWLGRLVTLDFGDSYKDHRPVRTRILEALPITLQINVISLFVVYMVSIPLGVFSATHRESKRDKLLSIGLFLLYSLPSFWVAMLLMYFLGGGGGSTGLQNMFLSLFTAIGVQDRSAVQWLLTNVLHFRWFPIYGLNSFGAESWPWHRWLLDRLWYLILPVFCLSYASLAYTSRFMRAGMIEVTRQDYVRTARAYGIGERVVIYKYAMRNALIPILTLLGEELPLLIGGSVIIEYIFSIPGMGRLAYEAILYRDYPVVMGVLSITAILTLLGIILSDILYAVADPRIKFD